MISKSMYYIYKITNFINGKTYIGQHKYTKLNDSYMGSGKLLIRAQKKYGIENFKKDILVFNISKQEYADLLEKTFIAFEREKVGRENCYNITDGGGGGSLKGRHFSEEHKRKISEANKGQVPWLKGKHMSDESRRKMSEVKKGDRNPMYGKHLSEETRKKLSEVHKGHSTSEETKRKIGEANKGHIVSSETKRKISEAKKGKHWRIVDGKRLYY